MTDFEKLLIKNLNGDLTPETMKTIKGALEKTRTEFIELDKQYTEEENNRQQAKKEKSNQGVNVFFEKIAENPDIISNIVKEIKKPNWTKNILKFAIILSIIIPITLLSFNGVLGTCETATLFGGIVGYLLGDLN